MVRPTSSIYCFTYYQSEQDNTEAMLDKQSRANCCFQFRDDSNILCNRNKQVSEDNETATTTCSNSSDTFRTALTPKNTSKAVGVIKKEDDDCIYHQASVYTTGINNENEEDRTTCASIDEDDEDTIMYQASSLENSSVMEEEKDLTSQHQDSLFSVVNSLDDDTQRREDDFDNYFTRGKPRIYDENDENLMDKYSIEWSEDDENEWYFWEVCLNGVCSATRKGRHNEKNKRAEVIYSGPLARAIIPFYSWGEEETYDDDDDDNDDDDAWDTDIIPVGGPLQKSREWEKGEHCEDLVNGRGRNIFLGMLVEYIEHSKIQPVFSSEMMHQTVMSGASILLREILRVNISASTRTTRFMKALESRKHKSNDEKSEHKEEHSYPTVTSEPPTKDRKAENTFFEEIAPFHITSDTRRSRICKAFGSRWKGPEKKTSTKYKHKVASSESAFWSLQESCINHKADATKLKGSNRGVTQGEQRGCQISMQQFARENIGNLTLILAQLLFRVVSRHQSHLEYQYGPLGLFHGHRAKESNYESMFVELLQLFFSSMECDFAIQWEDDTLDSESSHIQQPKIQPKPKFRSWTTFTRARLNGLTKLETIAEETDLVDDEDLREMISFTSREADIYSLNFVDTYHKSTPDNDSKDDHSEEMENIDDIEDLELLNAPGFKPFLVTALLETDLSAHDYIFAHYHSSITPLELEDDGMNDELTHLVVKEQELGRELTAVELFERPTIKERGEQKNNNEIVGKPEEDKTFEKLLDEVEGTQDNLIQQVLFAISKESDENEDCTTFAGTESTFDSQEARKMVGEALLRFNSVLQEQIGSNLPMIQPGVVNEASLWNQNAAKLSNTSYTGEEEDNYDISLGSHPTISAMSLCAGSASIGVEKALLAYRNGKEYPSLLNMTSASTASSNLHLSGDRFMQGSHGDVVQSPLPALPAIDNVNVQENAPQPYSFMTCPHITSLRMCGLFNAPQEFPKTRLLTNQAHDWKTEGPSDITNGRRKAGTHCTATMETVMFGARETNSPTVCDVSFFKPEQHDPLVIMPTFGNGVDQEELGDLPQFIAPCEEVVSGLSLESDFGHDYVSPAASDFGPKRERFCIEMLKQALNRAVVPDDSIKSEKSMYFNNTGPDPMFTSLISLPDQGVSRGSKCVLTPESALQDDIPENMDFGNDPIWSMSPLIDSFDINEEEQLVKTNWSLDHVLSPLIDIDDSQTISDPTCGSFNSFLSLKYEDPLSVSKTYTVDSEARFKAAEAAIFGATGKVEGNLRIDINEAELVTDYYDFSPENSGISSGYHHTQLEPTGEYSDRCYSFTKSGSYGSMPQISMNDSSIEIELNEQILRSSSTPTGTCRGELANNVQSKPRRLSPFQEIKAAVEEYIRGDIESVLSWENDGPGTESLTEEVDLDVLYPSPETTVASPDSYECQSPENGKMDFYDGGFHGLSDMSESTYEDKADSYTSSWLSSFGFTISSYDGETRYTAKLDTTAVVENPQSTKDGMEWDKKISEKENKNSKTKKLNEGNAPTAFLCSMSEMFSPFMILSKKPKCKQEKILSKERTHILGVKQY